MVLYAELHGLRYLIDIAITDNISAAARIGKRWKNHYPNANFFVADQLPVQCIGSHRDFTTAYQQIEDFDNTAQPFG